MAGELVLVTGITGLVGFKVLVTALQSGYRVRGAVRREAQVDYIKSQESLKPFLGQLSFVIVQDISVTGAFDAALKDVVYVLHVASPLPSPTEDPENDIIKPAVQGTLSILHSAKNVFSIRRVVITSSIVAVVSSKALLEGDPDNIYTPNYRVNPAPTRPYPSPASSYRASKIYALAAAEDFIAEVKPNFTLVHVMPSYVFGANELVQDAKSVIKGSNNILMGMMLGVGPSDARAGAIVHVDDVARIHVGSLDEKRVRGNRSIIASIPVDDFEEAIEIARRSFPEAVRDGRLPLSGRRGTLKAIIDSSETVKVFGEFKGFEEMVKSVVGHYLELLAKGTV